jgi:hypothetical protein
MKALRQLGFLKLPFREEGPEPEDHDRVLALFRNRAELKRVHGELQDEIYDLLHGGAPLLRPSSQTRRPRVILGRCG